MADERLGFGAGFNMAEQALKRLRGGSASGGNRSGMTKKQRQIWKKEKELGALDPKRIKEGLERKDKLADLEVKKEKSAIKTVKAAAKASRVKSKTENQKLIEAQLKHKRKVERGGYASDEEQRQKQAEAKTSQDWANAESTKAETAETKRKTQENRDLQAVNEAKAWADVNKVLADTDKQIGENNATGKLSDRMASLDEISVAVAAISGMGSDDAWNSAQKLSEQREKLSSISAPFSASAANVLIFNDAKNNRAAAIDAKLESLHKSVQYIERKRVEIREAGIDTFLNAQYDGDATFQKIWDNTRPEDQAEMRFMVEAKQAIDATDGITWAYVMNNRALYNKIFKKSQSKVNAWHTYKDAQGNDALVMDSSGRPTPNLTLDVLESRNGLKDAIASAKLVGFPLAATRIDVVRTGQGSAPATAIIPTQAPSPTSTASTQTQVTTPLRALDPQSLEGKKYTDVPFGSDFMTILKGSGEVDVLSDEERMLREEPGLIGDVASLAFEQSGEREMGISDVELRRIQDEQDQAAQMLQPPPPPTATPPVLPALPAPASTLGYPGGSPQATYELSTQSDTPVTATVRARANRADLAAAARTLAPLLAPGTSGTPATALRPGTTAATRTHTVPGQPAHNPFHPPLVAAQAEFDRLSAAVEVDTRRALTGMLRDAPLRQQGPASANFTPDYFVSQDGSTITFNLAKVTESGPNVSRTSSTIRIPHELKDSLKRDYGDSSPAKLVVELYKLNPVRYVSEMGGSTTRTTVKNRSSVPSFGRQVGRSGGRVGGTAGARDARDAFAELKKTADPADLNRKLNKPGADQRALNAKHIAAKAALKKADKEFDKLEKKLRLMKRFDQFKLPPTMSVGEAKEIGLIPQP